FRRSLHTNYVPSDSAVKGIQSHLISHHFNWRCPLRLEGLIKDLSAKRQEILNYIAAHETLTSPARQLRRDIVQEIFLACLPTHRNAVMSAKEAPLILARIYSAWQTLALSIPALHIPLE
ncbi:hypothetical protein FB451DRAFT_1048763, partial [Mycena latifolia]